MGFKYLRYQYIPVGAVLQLCTSHPRLLQLADFRYFLDRVCLHAAVGKHIPPSELNPNPRTHSVPPLVDLTLPPDQLDICNQILRQNRRGRTR